MMKTLQSAGNSDALSLGGLPLWQLFTAWFLSSLAWLSAAALLVELAGCGQRGPLVHPPQVAAAQAQQASAAAASNQQR